MKKTKLPLLAVLLAPALTFADTVSINWTGQIQIDGYEAVGSAFPQSLTDTSVSGVIIVNTNLLPAADQNNPPGIVSFGGSGYLQSSLQWAGGLFQPEPAGSSGGSNTLALDTTSNSVCTINDGSSYTDALGTSYSPFLTFTFNGLDQLGASLGLGSFGSAFSGGGQFFNEIVDTSGDKEDLAAIFTVDKVSVSLVPVPVPEPNSALSALTLLAGVLATVICTRRQRQTA